ncbi:MAG: cyclopentanol dehydrogenase, partial [Alphaproteobacteria bacterium HGW-Alphaproteobacteria-12]
MGRVDGKTAFVTGGANGMGRSHALLLAREGATLIVTDMDEKGGNAV